jgi:alanine racemase
MSRPIRSIIHYAALQHNLRVVQAKAKNAKLWAVVKANAYGHGLQHVFKTFRAADGFALLDLQEAQHLREMGWRGPILLLEGIFEARDLEVCSRLGLWHTIHNDAQIEMLAAHKTLQGHRVFLKLNAGMNRLGFDARQFRSVWARLNAMHQVEEISLLSHFARTESAQDVIESLRIFNEACHDLPGERSLSNSGAILAHQDVIAKESIADDWVRPGIALYGASPDAHTKTALEWGLLPAQSLRSQIIGLQRVSVGERVGYGSDHTAQENMLIGVVACGYADGYPRVLRSGAQVLFESGVRCNLFGRVSMDMLTINLNPALEKGLEPKIGAEVTLWGKTRNGIGLAIDEVAAHAGTIGYELMCAVAQRVPVEEDLEGF